MARGFSLQDIACVTLEGSLHGTPAPSLSGTESTKKTTATTTTTTATMQQQPQTNPIARDSKTKPPPSFSYDNKSNNLCGGGGGLIASGLFWFDKRREKARREHLKAEAEKQLQKIGEAHRASLRQSATSGTAASSAAFSSIAIATASERDRDNHQEQDHDHELGNVEIGVARNKSLADSSSSSSSQTSGIDLVKDRSLGSVASGSESEGERVIRNSSSVEEKRSRQQKFVMQPSNSFGTSDVSKSGEGASGMLYLGGMDGFCAGEETETMGSNNEDENEMIESEKDNAATIEDKDVDYITSPVRVTEVEGDDASPYILSQNQMDEISKHVLPETISYCRWRRLYGLGRDGDSFEGCLRIIGSEKRTLMVVRTTKGDIFGGYADAPWHSRHDSSTAKFYGTASSCLYSFSSVRTPYSTSSSPETSPINVYRWTGKNRYIQVCDVSNKMLAFGGGGNEGAFGLCLQEDFQRGTTGHCDTFDNDPLCSGGQHQHEQHEQTRTFDIVDVEFWEFLTGVF